MRKYLFITGLIVAYCLTFLGGYWLGLCEPIKRCKPANPELQVNCGGVSQCDTTYIYNR